MDFRIADTFTDSLARLTGDEQKVVKTTAFDLQMNPASPGMSFHKLDKAHDKNFWSVRVSRDIRLIVHRTAQSLLLCYVGHHDDAYHWAECRKIETHPQTGAAQIVEVRTRIQEIAVPRYVEVERPAPAASPLFAGVADDDLLGWGVPAEWLADVRAVNSEDALLVLTDHLPAEAAEALLDLATGVQPKAAVATKADPFEHPDAQRRFRSIRSSEELQRAMDSPWDQWTIFLHPAQREWVEKDFSGPARVSGSAGTGKTIVALHRAVHLARANPDGRVLLTTFSEPLANALQVKLRRLIGNEPHLGERIDVSTLDAMARRLYQTTFGTAHVASAEEMNALIDTASRTAEDHGISVGFLRTEWRDVVDAWQLKTWEAYRDVRRLGRRIRLREARRQKLWAIFEAARAALDSRGWMTEADLLDKLAQELPKRRHLPYDFIVADEAQDVGVAPLRFLAALGAGRPNALFFAGDQGQRIFQQPFSWKSLGVDIRGRARTLHVNYRTSHQIRAQADRLLDPEVTDVDGNEETRKGTVSVFNGPEPEVRAFADVAAEATAAGAWLCTCADKGIAAHEMAVFVRSGDQLDRAEAVVRTAGRSAQVLDERIQVQPGKVVVSTMHLAKGLEFRTVAVIACDDEVIPSQQRIGAVTDGAELEEVYNTERQLLYVACTRARDQLWVSGVKPVSEFLDDLLKR